MKNNSTIVNTNATAKFLWALTILFSFNTSQSWGQYFVGFEGAGETKTAYASGNVTLSGIQWNMTNALIGTLADDWKNGARSARLRGLSTSVMTMNANKANGAGIISFQYRRYGTDAQVTWRVDYSTNNGSTWTQAGSNFTGTASVQTFSATVNVTGNVRIRIIHVSGGNTSTNRRLNIDDIQITDYTVAATPTITLSESTISGLDYNLNNGPSANQTFTVSGTNLTANIVLNAPPNFEISTSSTTGFASSLTLTPTAGTVNPTTIYTRLAANLGVGIYTGTLNATSSGASAQNISLNGKVLPTLTSIGVAYTEDFSSYSSAATVPSGWSVVSSGGVNSYIGAWGSGITGGQRGAGVLGYQHTGGSGVVTKTLTLLNDIGATINQLEISYDGKVERATEGRTPEYTVTVNGTTISGLTYSTVSGVDESIIFTVTGLNILNGETVEIRWSSDRGENSLGSSRQIGIDNVTVMVPNNTALPVELSAFSGVYNKHFSVLNWETESEQNNDYFTLYHSTNGKSFEQIGRVSGSGNTSSLLSYTFEHREPRPGINYYKLTSTDYDGTIHYKGIVAVLVEMNHVFYDQITQSIQMNYSSDYAIYGSDGRLIERVANQNVIPFSGHGVFHVIDERSGKTFKLGVW